jgi:hypothetical protein
MKTHSPGATTAVKSSHYHIVRKENERRMLWLEDAEDLDSAKSRIQELTSFWPGEFQVMDQQTYQIVAKVNGPPESGERGVEQNLASH